MPAKFLICGIHSLCVDGAEHALRYSADFEFAGRAANLVELVRFAEEGVEPHVVLLSAHYRSTAQLASDVSDCRRLFPDSRLVVFGCMLDRPEVVAGLAATGAVLLPNPLRLVGFASSVAAAIDRPEGATSRAARRLIGASRTSGGPRKTTAEELTQREAQILKAVAEGMTNATIADHLGLSERTVKNHLYRVYQKLGVGSRGQAAVEALRRGLV